MKTAAEMKTAAMASNLFLVLVGVGLVTLASVKMAQDILGWNQMFQLSLGSALLGRFIERLMLGMKL